MGGNNRSSTMYLSNSHQYARYPFKIKAKDNKHIAKLVPHSWSFKWKCRI